MADIPTAGFCRAMNPARPPESERMVRNVDHPLLLSPHAVFWRRCSECASWAPVSGSSSMRSTRSGSTRARSEARSPAVVASRSEKCARNASRFAAPGSSLVPVYLL